MYSLFLMSEGWQPEKGGVRKRPRWKVVTVSMFFTESALRPIQSESRDVRPSVCLSVWVQFILRPLIGPQVT